MPDISNGFDDLQEYSLIAPPAVNLKVKLFEDQKTKSMSPKVRALSIKDRVYSSRKSGADIVN